MIFRDRQAAHRAYELALDALASEHAERLSATQAAEQWLEERMQRVRALLASARRETSTQEVIEIAAAYRLRQRASVAPA